MQDSQVVDLNVGGRHLTTSLSTLTKYPDSMLATMFSGRHPVAKDKDGRYFIDVEGDVFVHILNFLRFGKMPPPERASEVNEYAEYFGLQELKAPVPEDFEQVLYGIWKKELPDYQRHWEKVKEQLGNISTSYFYICTRKSDCGKLPKTDIGALTPGNYYTIELSFDSNVSIFFNLLAVDLKKRNVFTDSCLRECPGCCCRAAMGFRIGR
ncbi:BTB/POZ domain-containing protein KCTD7-like isoform X3 [Haliotis rufescens]|uniref:BTB/POZ domain-containing protein KCTD7-like isoform X3 n=1 Tax=Haliotis rufescens TaxID=6454 RepID=UPI00201ECFCB|nr:BTB/POZ domain-containing protein KCTD7-like isoform X3 [Haliotis rufescens]